MSESHKKRIVRAFRGLAAETNEIDEALLVIRKALEEKYGRDFDFYQDNVQPLWDAKPPNGAASEEELPEESRAAESEPEIHDGVV